MAYSIISVENLAELKTRRGNSTNTTMATVLGLDYPNTEAFAVYVWDNLSTATPDDNQIIQPTVGGIPTGRWFKVDIGIDTALIIAALGYVPYDASNPLGFISSFIETDPIWTSVAGNYRTKAQNDLLYEPVFSKNTAFNKNFGTTSNTVTEGNDSRVNNGQTAFSWGNHSTAGYLTPTSTNTLTNKSGNISQWTNDSGYLTSVPAQSFASLTGKPTTIGGYGITDFNSLGDARWSLLGHIHTFASLTSKPTTLGGYGITDAYPLTGNPSGFLSSLSAGTGVNIVGNTITNSAPDQTVTLTAGNRISITGTYPNFTIGYIEPTVNIITSKTLNSNFTISTTKQAIVSYSLTCTVTNPLLAGSSTANVYLEYSTNGGSTWNLPSQNGNASTVGVAVAVAITNGQTVTVSGVIPANALVRLRTATTGTANVTYVTGTEIY